VDVIDDCCDYHGTYPLQSFVFCVFIVCFALFFARFLVAPVSASWSFLHRWIASSGEGVDEVILTDG